MPALWSGVKPFQVEMQNHTTFVIVSSRTLVQMIMYQNSAYMMLILHIYFYKMGTFGAPRRHQRVVILRWHQIFLYLKAQQSWVLEHFVGNLVPQNGFA